MIKVESAHIEEVRGIKNLDIDFLQSTFAISDPNGSGKSGVIDAIEFALTGQISRLTGRGTKGLSIAEHGPHVDKAKFSDAAFVRLTVYLTDLKKSATITRKLKTPNKLEIQPPEPAIKAALAEVANHPEIALSRREILRFVLAEPTKRSEEIQTILKLDDIGEMRSALNTAQNKLLIAQKNAAAQVQSSREALLTHLQIPTLNAENVLDATNKRRKLLGLAEIGELTAHTKLDEGLASGVRVQEFNKQSALRDLDAALVAAKIFSTLAAGEAAAILTDIGRLESDPALLIAVQRQSFIEKGLELVTGPECPLRDTAWDSDEHLRAHLKEKLAKSKESQEIQRAMLKNGSAIAQPVIRIVGHISTVQRLATGLGETAFAQLLAIWKTDLDGLKTSVGTVDGLMGLKDRLSSGWPAVLSSLLKDLEGFIAKVTEKPDQTATIDAQTFLATAEVRLGDYREAGRKSKAAGVAAAASKRAYETYSAVMGSELNALYEKVQKDFSAFYRAVNEDDEAGFAARLTPSEGSLGLDVNFYDRGLFPPAAYHSEGHQDGMDVCLYLALMKRLFGERFTFALLDDVVMSVDSGHRYQFCKLLKTQFPNTQFVITTHDRLWAEQMKTAKLVTAKTSLAFHSWTIETGPLVESNDDIWQEIEKALKTGKVEAAAHTFRHHLEYIARHLADQIGAASQFRADGNYDLGELLPSVLKRLKDLYGKATEAAQSWGNTTAKDAAIERKKALSASNAALRQDYEWLV
jgi:RecF/RecN/SMC N terminal domain